MITSRSAELGIVIEANLSRECQMIEISNDGPEIVSTNYWQSEHAERGLLYLSANAGAWRLLVPSAASDMIAEMRTGKSVTIEPSIQVPGRCWDVVFEDGSDSPFAVAIDKQQVDRKMEPGACILSVWTRAGKVLELPCTIKI